MDDFGRLIDYYEAQLRKLGVEVVLNQRVLPEQIKDDGPDTLILALGGRPMTTRVPGRDRAQVCQAVDALLGKVSLGDRVLLIGGNYIACQTAAHFAQHGKKVTLATRRKTEGQLGGELEAVSQYMLVRMLRGLGVELLLGHNLVDITEEGGVFEGSGAKASVDADNVLLSLGYLPKRQEVRKFWGLAQRVCAVGDCVRPRRTGPAIHEGFVAGYEA
jgi:pyruvate/2-oxoglutarate dehydrogenase complex dihydrolipoamide dehydrogenase (E3) component